MTDLWQQFLALDANAQAVVVGLAVSVLMGVVKKLWKGFAAGPAEVKFVTALVLAGVAGYVVGGWPRAVLAVIAALGGYDGGKNLLRGVVQPVVADYRAATADTGDWRADE